MINRRIRWNITDAESKGSVTSFTSYNEVKQLRQSYRASVPWFTDQLEVYCFINHHYYVRAISKYTATTASNSINTSSLIRPQWRPNIQQNNLKAPKPNMSLHGTKYSNGCTVKVTQMMTNLYIGMCWILLPWCIKVELIQIKLLVHKI